MTQNQYIAMVVAATCLLSLAACGGGGGGGSRPTLVEPAPDPTALTRHTTSTRHALPHTSQRSSNRSVRIMPTPGA